MGHENIPIIDIEHKNQPTSYQYPKPSDVPVLWHFVTFSSPELTGKLGLDVEIFNIYQTLDNMDSRSYNEELKLKMRRNPIEARIQALERMVSLLEYQKTPEYPPLENCDHITRQVIIFENWLWENAGTHLLNSLENIKTKDKKNLSQRDNLEDRLKSLI